MHGSWLCKFRPICVENVLPLLKTILPFLLPASSSSTLQSSEQGRRINAAVVQTGKYVVQTGKVVGECRTHYLFTVLFLACQLRKLEFKFCRNSFWHFMLRLAKSFWAFSNSISVDNFMHAGLQNGSWLARRVLQWVCLIR